MNTENDHSYFECSLLRESDRAYLVSLNTPGPEGTVEFWVPKKLCVLRDKLGGGGKILEVESWYAKKEEME